mmetsp:Transcript_19933/g.76354  ORF Transcript_19933/g.76354 Transcript_19933/m.76354 type:complete len:370 (+) Transcript_19933:408-1517(+)
MVVASGLHFGPSPLELGHALDEDGESLGVVAEVAHLAGEADDLSAGGEPDLPRANAAVLRLKCPLPDTDECGGVDLGSGLHEAVPSRLVGEVDERLFVAFQRALGKRRVAATGRLLLEGTHQRLARREARREQRSGGARRPRPAGGAAAGRLRFSGSFPAATNGHRRCGSPRVRGDGLRARRRVTRGLRRGVDDFNAVLDAVEGRGGAAALRQPGMGKETLPGEAAVGVRLEEALEEMAAVHRHRNARGEAHVQGVAHDLLVDLDARRGLDRCRTEQHLVHDAAHAPEVGLDAVLAVAEDLWCHVQWSAALRRRHVVEGQQSCKAKVRNLQHRELALWVPRCLQENVLRLKVPVHDVHFPQVLQARHKV